MSKILSSRDLQFLLYEWLDVEALCRRERFAAHDRGTFDAFLDVAEQLAESVFAPHNASNDRHEPTFDGEHVHLPPEVGAAIAAFNEAGMVSASMDENVGGVQLPNVIHRACFAWFQAANIATAAYPMLSMANANLLLAHGDQAQIDRFARPIADGRFFGTMCLSEPQAGSSLSDVTTRAVPAEDGSYRLFGTKMWISGGEHDISENIVHLVLARRVGSPSGVNGLSLYIVPKVLVGTDGSRGAYNDVALVGLNHKMGYRGTVNTVLAFGEGKHLPGGEAGAIGYLVGEDGAGLAYMFHMMNEARIGVGAGAAALGYTGYLHALDYARTRPQGRSKSSDPDGPQVPIIAHADVRRMLIAAKSYVEGGLALVLYAARLVDEQRTALLAQGRERAGLLLDVLTPIVKSWPAQWCLVANDLAIQIHGGYGYTQDYPVEQFYRDNRLNAIHEGTHGIQARDLLGRKMRMRGGAGLTALLTAIKDTTDATLSDIPDLAARLDEAADRVADLTSKLWDGRDADAALANASIYLEAVGHIVVAWMWLEQLHVTLGKTGDFYAGKRAAATYFFDYELPRALSQLDVLSRRDSFLLDLDDRWF